MVQSPYIWSPQLQREEKGMKVRGLINLSAIWRLSVSLRALWTVSKVFQAAHLASNMLKSKTLQRGFAPFEALTALKNKD